MFKDVLKERKSSKEVKKWKIFGDSDANRWKREGNVQSMVKLTKKIK